MVKETREIQTRPTPTGRSKRSKLKSERNWIWKTKARSKMAENWVLEDMQRSGDHVWELQRYVTEANRAWTRTTKIGTTTKRKQNGSYDKWCRTTSSLY